MRRLALKCVEKLREEVNRATSSGLDTFFSPLDLWAKSVYLVANAFILPEGPSRLDALRVLWKVCFLVKEIQWMSNEKVEVYIKGQLETAINYKTVLIINA